VFEPPTPYDCTCDRAVTDERPPPPPGDRESPPSSNALEWIGLRQSLTDPPPEMPLPSLPQYYIYTYYTHTKTKSSVNLPPLGPTIRSALGKESACQYLRRRAGKRSISTNVDDMGIPYLSTFPPYEAKQMLDPTLTPG